MANLYDQADSNKRKTYLLIFGFLVFIILLGWFFSFLLDSFVILIIAVILSVLMSFGSYWYSDKLVLKMTKAVPVEKEKNKELYRIVENLCMAAGLPVPRIYIIEESQPNAFATGRNPKHAVVAVTRGLLEKLDRSELEGVIAHELSHIGNRDMLLGTVIVVFVGIVALLSNLFLRISFFGGLRGRSSKGGSLQILFLVSALIAAILAPIAATLIKLAVSRRREFLADSSGALLTRYPEGLARALEKISQDSSPMKVAGNSTAHLFISSPFRGKKSKSWFTKLFLTHPPAEERVKKLRGQEI